MTVRPVATPRRAGLCAAAAAALLAAPALAQDPETRVVSQERGVTNCAELEGVDTTRSAKVSPPFRDDVVFSDSRLRGSIDVQGRRFSFDLRMAVDAVIVKGGPLSRVYIYDGEVRSDSGLRAPINPRNGKPYGISHIIFCYDLRGEQAEEDRQDDNATITTPRGRQDSDETVKVGVGGDGIEQVRYFVNGDRVRTLNAKRGRNVFRLNVDMADGTQRVQARVRFRSGRVASLSRTIRARRAQVSPGFTG